MGKIVLYIACSLDGYIADRSGGIEWLESLPNPEGEDHGYQVLLSSVSSILMGRLTYEKILSFGIEWPYAGLTTFVATHRSDWKISTPNTEVWAGGLHDKVRQLKRNAEKDCWLVGGGILIASLLEAELIDRMIISMAPVLLGAGVPLFPAGIPVSEWSLTEVKSYTTGIASLTYDRKPRAS
jgi:dihydrofolate reductase